MQSRNVAKWCALWHHSNHPRHARMGVADVAECTWCTNGQGEVNGLNTVEREACYAGVDAVVCITKRERMRANQLAKAVHLTHRQRQPGITTQRCSALTDRPI